MTDRELDAALLGWWGAWGRFPDGGSVLADLPPDRRESVDRLSRGRAEDRERVLLGLAERGGEYRAPWGTTYLIETDGHGIYQDPAVLTAMKTEKHSHANRLAAIRRANGERFGKSAEKRRRAV